MPANEKIFKQDLFKWANQLMQLAPQNFDELALALFRYQAKMNPIYKKYLSLLNCHPQMIQTVEAIPFLPIELFKKYALKCGTWNAETTFLSSGTTDIKNRSKHLIRSVNYYHQMAIYHYESLYGPIDGTVVLALLPHYLSQKNSSLVDMVQAFINKSDMTQSNFYLDNFSSLEKMLTECIQQDIPTLFIGVSYALVDFSFFYTGPKFTANIKVMETGGMKGKRREMIREELHSLLKSSFHISNIYSEYGMTELLSQAYTLGDNKFIPAKSMKIIPREINDPFSSQQPGRNAVLNIIDLANRDTCAFIATQDLCRTYPNGQFEVLGRLDNSEMRGCNLLLH